MTLALKPHRPPQTPREVLHYFLGDDHSAHTLVEYEPLNLGVHVSCSCGRSQYIDEDLAYKLGCIALSEVRAALESAPKKHRSQ